MELSKKQQKWFKQLEDLWNFVDTRLNNYDLSTKDLRFVVLFHMTGATHRIIRGFIAQLKEGSNDDVESKLRTLNEATININYILADETGNRAKAFLINGTRSRLSAIRRILDLLRKEKAPAMAEVANIKKYERLQSNLEKEISDSESLFGKENILWPNLEQRAQKGNSEEIYATAFWLFSESSHMTAEGLNRFLRDNDGVITMTTELDLTRLDQEIQTAFVSYIAFLNTCSQKLGFPPENELEEFNKSEMLPYESS
jgi:hypothetical protein